VGARRWSRKTWIILAALTITAAALALAFLFTGGTSPTY
jgi:hypothetical protein